MFLQHNSPFVCSASKEADRKQKSFILWNVAKVFSVHKAQVVTEPSPLFFIALWFFGFSEGADRNRSHSNYLLALSNMACWFTV